MAACLISFTGTGLAQINYSLASIPYTIRSNGGDFFIDDTATNLTYTTLTGNLIPSSVCLTINALPFTYFKWGWKDIKAIDHQVVGILFNEEVIDIDEIDFPETTINLVRSVNSGVDDRFKIVGYRRVSSGWEDTYTVAYDYIVKTIGATEIYLVVENEDGELLYITGDSFNIGDLTPDFTQVTECYPSVIGI